MIFCAYSGQHFCAELKLCPVNDKLGQETAECMDKHPLHLIEDPTSTKFYIPLDSKKKDTFKYKVQSSTLL